MQSKPQLVQNSLTIVCVCILLFWLGCSAKSTAQYAGGSLEFGGILRVTASGTPYSVPELNHRLSLSARSRISSRVALELDVENRQVWGSPHLMMGVNTPVFHTNTAVLRIDARNRSDSTSSGGWGTWTLGRQKFQLGPVGLLAANPFDALEAIRWTKEWSTWQSDIIAARIDTSYVTYLNYVYDHDPYLALRAERPYAKSVIGTTWLAQGLGSERGLSVDVAGEWSNERQWILEVAAYEQSRTSSTYDGWTMAAIGSIDLYVNERTSLSLNAGTVGNSFVPMASNLGYAGGSLGFSNDSKGVEVYVSHLLHPTIVLDIQLGLRSRWHQPDSNVQVALTLAQPEPLISYVSLERKDRANKVEWLSSIASEIRF